MNAAAETVRNSPCPTDNTSIPQISSIPVMLHSTHCPAEVLHASMEPGSSSRVLCVASNQVVHWFCFNDTGGVFFAW